jgi:Protein of unknown function (DUF2934)
MPNREQLIRERAYVLWEQEGCPDGRADVHWCMAVEQIGNQTLGSPVATAKRSKGEKVRQQPRLARTRRAQGRTALPA